MKTGQPRPVKVGLVPISKFVFSREDALRYKALTEGKLRRLGVEFVNIDGVTEDGTLFRHEDLPGVVRHLRAAGVDALFCPHCNFGTEDVAALLGKEMGLPYLLWGPRDEAPLADGTRLRDTQCGLFATSRILQALGVPFTYIPNCRLDDPCFARGVLAFLQVASVVKAFRRMRIGQIGQRIDFFWTVMINEAELLERFGIEVFQIYLPEVMDRIGALVNSPTEDLEAEVAAMREWVTFEAMEERQVNAVAALRLTMAELVERHGLSALCVQCFPEFQRAFGIYPCLANSLVTMNQVPVVCETDVHGAITAALLHAATLYQSPPFFADLTIRHPERDNVELLWHCGSFPVNLAEEGVRPRVGEHFIMPEAAAGVGHWRIRGGEITLARFAGHQREYRLAFGEGRGSDGPPTVGTYLWLEVDDWSAWERQFIRGPYIHHVAGVHGSLSPVLCEACRYLPGIQPDPVGQSVDAVENFWWQEK